jgi:hypothetical protein
MNQKEIEQKIAAYCSGRLSPEEEHDIERYAADHPMLMDALEGYLDDPSQIDRIKDLKSLVVAPKQKILTLKSLLPYVAATALLLVIVTSIYKQGQAPDYADVETSSPVLAESIPAEVDMPTVVADRTGTTTSVGDSGGLAMEMEEEVDLPQAKDVSVTPSSPPSKKSVSPKAKVSRQQALDGSADQSDLVATPSSPPANKSLAQQESNPPSAAMSTDEAGDITVGKAHKSTSSARPARRKLLDQYFASDQLSISGSLPLNELSATSPWPQVWQAVSQLAKENNQKSGTATLRLRVDGDQVTATPMKNMAALTDSGIVDYLTTSIGLTAKSGQSKEWLIKLEFK